jgi:hypothetical protein
MRLPRLHPIPWHRPSFVRHVEFVPTGAYNLSGAGGGQDLQLKGDRRQARFLSERDKKRRNVGIGQGSARLNCLQLVRGREKVVEVPAPRDCRLAGTA